MVASSGILTAPFADAQAYGLSFWTTHPGACTTGHFLAVQTLGVNLCRAVKTETINKLGIWVGGAGVTPGAGVNGLGIFDQNGNLLSNTGDMTTAFSTTGYAEAALAAGVPVTAGVNYFLGVQHNFTGTSPAFPAADCPVALPIIRTLYVELFQNGTTSWASFTPGSISLGNYVHFITAGT
jgi:hypothetical protein